MVPTDGDRRYGGAVFQSAASTVPADAPVVGDRAVRADARRNRDAILRAADQAFGQRGVDAQMSDVARLAGLGVGTLYRHFPTKEALVDALLLDHLEHAESLARAAATEPDPWTGLERLILSIGELSANRYLAQFMGGRINGSPALRQQRRAVFEVLSCLTDAAKRSGKLRQDVAATDLLIIITTLARAGWGGSELAHRTTARHLGIVLDGLRAPATRALEGEPLSHNDISTLAEESAPRDCDAFRRGQRGR